MYYCKSEITIGFNRLAFIFQIIKYEFGFTAAGVIYVRWKGLETCSFVHYVYYGRFGIRQAPLSYIVSYAVILKT